MQHKQAHDSAPDSTAIRRTHEEVAKLVRTATLAQERLDAARTGRDYATARSERVAAFSSLQDCKVLTRRSMELLAGVEPELQTMTARDVVMVAVDREREQVLDYLREHRRRLTQWAADMRRAGRFAEAQLTDESVDELGAAIAGIEKGEHR